MNQKDFLSKKNNKILIKLNVKPNSKQQKIYYDSLSEMLTIYLKSPPDKGKANNELIKYLARIFDISSSKISLIAGHTSRDKIIAIDDYPFDLILKNIMKNCSTSE